MVVPLLEFNRQATRFHVAGHKLQLLAHYYWVTRDAGSLRAWEPLWGPVVEFLVSSRRKDNGLMPPDNYAGDISQEVPLNPSVQNPNQPGQGGQPTSGEPPGTFSFKIVAKLKRPLKL